MKAFSIRTKFIIISVSIAVAILVIVAIGIFSTKTIVSYENATILVNKMEVGMLTLRRNEKDFLARNDLKYQKKFSKNYAALQENVSKLKNSLQDKGIDTEKVEGLKMNLADYNVKFNALINEQKNIGLTPKTGLYGALREAVHNAESKIKSLNDASLMKDMLMLRRREKDFMLRNDMKYLAKFNTDIITIEKTLANSTHSSSDKELINKNLQQYKQDFSKLVKGYQVKGLDSKKGLLGEMRSSVHKTETLFKELDYAITKAGEEKVTLINTIYIVSSLFFAIAIIGFIVFILKNILFSLTKLSNLMQDVESNNNLTIRCTNKSNDEIGMMSFSFNKMLEKFEALVQQINSSSTQLATASEEVSSVSQESTNGIDRKSVV